MKKIVIAGAIALASSTAYSQGAYVSLSGGYGMPSGVEQLGEKRTVTSTGDFTSEAILGTLGTGVNVQLDAGYMVTSNIGVDLGVNYLMGSTVVWAEETNDQASSTDKFESKSTQIRIMPTMVFTTDLEKLNLYSKVGLVLPVSGKTELNSVSTGEILGATARTVYKAESFGALSLGYTGSIGASFKLSDKLSVFGELQAINLRVKQKNMTLNEAYIEIGGTRTDFPLETMDKETEFVTSINQDDNTDTNVASKELVNSSNFNSLGLQVGIKFNF